MSYQYVPSLLRVPDFPNCEWPDGIWRGKGRDDGLYAFWSPNWKKHVIVRGGNFSHGLRIGGNVFTPVAADVNGYGYWDGGGEGWVYYSRLRGWVLAYNFPGCEPVESYTTTESGKTWHGDRFYTLDPPPGAEGRTAVLSPRGSIRETGEALYAEPWWPRWEAVDGEFGVYEGKDGESGEKTLGLPRFRCGDEWFTRSLARDARGRFTYGRIHWDGEAWVIGEAGSESGWHVGSEPSPDSPATFSFRRNEGSEATGSDMTVSFVDYVCGDGADPAFLGSVAVWR